MELYLLWTFMIWLTAFSGLTLGKGCWRDTPCDAAQEAAFPGEWESNIYAPTSRTVSPPAAFDLESRKRLRSWPGEAALHGSQKGVYFDFGTEVGGIVTIEFEAKPLYRKGTMLVAFTEAADWIGPMSDSSNGDDKGREDGALRVALFVPGKHTYVMPDRALRGGFRYMTLVVEGNAASVRITNVSLEISFQPTWSNLRAYGGYFHSSDELLNKIWYSCAYTLQLNAIHPVSGRTWPSPRKGWHNDGLLGRGNTINTDGAKRDRAVWPGDMGVAIPASAYSTGDVESIRNSLRVLYDHQDRRSGAFPYCGPPIGVFGSVTYHMWAMIGTYNYVLHSGDIAFARENWKGYLRGMDYLYKLIHPIMNLLKVPKDASNDWGQPNASDYHTSAQTLFFHTLRTGAKLADWINEEDNGNTTSTSTSGRNQASWAMTAAMIQATVNELHWDANATAFRNNLLHLPGGHIHPQDGNSLAVLLGLVELTSARAQSISAHLEESNWTPIGATSPELPGGEISPFISSFEIQAHLVAGQTQRALDLIRNSWGWYLNNPNGTQSTAIEGYLSNGSFGYRWDQGYNGGPSYTSHAHGWSTGPVTALTERVLGLSVVEPAGRRWRLAPMFGDLRGCEGGFRTGLGRFSASWSLGGEGEEGSEGGRWCQEGRYTLGYDTPNGTVGELLLPLPGPRGDFRAAADAAWVRVMVDGVEKEQQELRENTVEASGDRLLIALRGSGGKHRIDVSWESGGDGNNRKPFYAWAVAWLNRGYGSGH